MSRSRRSSGLYSIIPWCECDGSPITGAFGLELRYGHCQLPHGCCGTIPPLFFRIVSPVFAKPLVYLFCSVKAPSSSAAASTVAAILSTAGDLEGSAASAAMDTLFITIKSKLRVPSLLVQALRALELITRTSTANSASFVTSHGFTNVFPAMDCNPKHEGIAEVGCLLLLTVLEHDSPAAKLMLPFQVQGGLSRIMACMERFPRNIRLQEIGCRIIHLTAVMPCAFTHVIPPSNLKFCVDKVLAAKAHHPASLSLQGIADGALTVLLCQEETVASCSITSPPQLSAEQQSWLFAGLATHSYDTVVQCALIGKFSRLFDVYADSVGLFIREGGLVRIGASMLSHPTDPSVQSTAFNALWSLLKGGCEFEFAAAYAVATGAPAPPSPRLDVVEAVISTGHNIVSLMLAALQNPEWGVLGYVQVPAFMCLASFASCDVGRAAIVSQDGMPVLLNHYANKASAMLTSGLVPLSTICRLVTNFARTPENVPELVRLGALHAVASVLRDHNADINVGRFGCLAVWLMYQNGCEATLPPILDSGVVDLVDLAASSHVSCTEIQRLRDLIESSVAHSAGVKEAVAAVVSNPVVVPMKPEQARKSSGKRRRP